MNSLNIHIEVIRSYCRRMVSEILQNTFLFCYRSNSCLNVTVKEKTFNKSECFQQIKNIRVLIKVKLHAQFQLSGTGFTIVRNTKERKRERFE